MKTTSLCINNCLLGFECKCYGFDIVCPIWVMKVRMCNFQLLQLSITIMIYKLHDTKVHTISKINVIFWRNLIESIISLVCFNPIPKININSWLLCISTSHIITKYLYMSGTLKLSFSISYNISSRSWQAPHTSYAQCIPMNEWGRDFDNI
jgi:hypothetical protein